MQNLMGRTDAAIDADGRCGVGKFGKTLQHATGFERLRYRGAFGKHDLAPPDGLVRGIKDLYLHAGYRLTHRRPPGPAA